MIKKFVCVFVAVLIAAALFGCSNNAKVLSDTPLASQESRMSDSAQVSDETMLSSYNDNYNFQTSSSTLSLPSSSQGNVSKAPSSSKAAVSSTAPRKEISVLIPPGFTVRKIAARMEAKGVCKAADFIKAVNTGDFSAYSVTNGIADPQKRCYRLEGYLYPDTYTFYENSAPEEVIKKILQNTQKKLVGKYSRSDMTLDQIITLASLIEKEGGGNNNESGKISSVLHNRLKQGKALQLDAPVYYLENEMEDADTQKYKIWYNTYNYQNREVKYECPGLPAGAICSPCAASLKAATDPETTDYLFFGSDKNKNYFYAVTYDEFKEKGTELGVNIK